MLLHERLDRRVLDDDQLAAVAGAALPLIARPVQAGDPSMRSQQAAVNERMMIRRSLFGARHPIRCAYNSANTKSARLSSNHIANCTSLGTPMHLRPVS